MAPPPFADLGKATKDLFTKGYTHGFVKVDVTADSGPTMEFKTTASHNVASQKLNGNLEVKYKAVEHGLKLTEKWNTDNQLATIIELNDKIARGLKVILDTSYTPHTGKRGGLLKTEWTGEALKVNADLTLLGGPIFNLAVVGQLKYDWLLGAQAKFDLASNELKTTTVAVGRKTGDYTLHSFTIDGREYGASLYHNVHSNFQYGVQLGWKTGDQSAHWGLASKYKANKDLTFQAKLDSKSQVAVASTHTMSDGLKLTLAASFGLLGLPETPVKCGLGIEYSPRGDAK